jgi:hypothetical protein
MLMACNCLSECIFKQNALYMYVFKGSFSPRRCRYFMMPEIFLMDQDYFLIFFVLIAVHSSVTCVSNSTFSLNI